MQGATGCFPVDATASDPEDPPSAQVTREFPSSPSSSAAKRPLPNDDPPPSAVSAEELAVRRKKDGKDGTAFCEWQVKVQVPPPANSKLVPKNEHVQKKFAKVRGSRARQVKEAFVSKIVTRLDVFSTNRVVTLSVGCRWRNSEGPDLSEVHRPAVTPQFRGITFGRPERSRMP